MTGQVAALWRHPIKAHGREALQEVTLTAGQTFPWDRIWAVTHEASKAQGGQWSPCPNFSRGAKAPQLMAITAHLDEQSEHVTLRHPEQAEITINPDDTADAARFIDWVQPLMPEGRAASTGLIRAGEQGMTDSAFPSISIGNLASLRALSAAVGTELSPDRFRANIWIDGPEAWSEFDWIGETIRIRDVELKVQERITRCLATATNPETGERDTDTLGVLQSNWGHRDFGIYVTVSTGGRIAPGDALRLT
ncbi:MOSC domain-containing protein [Qingshengfaniella alkalisoli]|uniref:MOSC domain-containing protein n=1 Tax=Qingshengfaniella alkalisoli TaxID=2599296 RepID=A0A5B8IUQ7_9RHOB|nr:MOSC N-terminal beta barrel domain-containing protein [Qingshengfaniella alkalisoli]QDY69852.1 MOSC domain-containing protein [Qingshengfaniella alkalisoli]